MEGTENERPRCLVFLRVRCIENCASMRLMNEPKRLRNMSTQDQQHVIRVLEIEFIVLRYWESKRERGIKGAGLQSASAPQIGEQRQR
jgi:hypothetical protein